LLIKYTHLAGAGSRPATGAQAGGGRTGPAAGARGGGDRRTGRRRRPEHGAKHGAAAGARAGARGGGRRRRAGRRRGCGRAAATHTGRETDGARVKMKRRAGRIRVKTSYLRRLCTRPSEIRLSPTAVYEAVGDKAYFRAPVVAVGHNLISDGLIQSRRR
jgi:hypothetical protein